MDKSNKNKWKSIGFNLESAGELLCFEELTDYKAIRGKISEAGNTENDEVDKVDAVPHKKRKRKKKLVKNRESNRDPIKRKQTSDLGCPVPVKISNTEFAQDEKPAQKIVADSEVELTKMDSWREFNLPESILRALAWKKFEKPTEIQKLTLPEAMMKKKDVLGAAATGSGKTFAFAIPIVASILEAQENGVSTDNNLWALIVTPTRELSVQVKNHISDLCKFTNIKVQDIVGGLSIEKQTRTLKEKPHIIVATLGRLWEMIKKGHEHLNDLHKIRFLVIDEADRMFEKNHFEEFPYLLEHLNSPVEKSKHKIHRQTFVFSATLTLTHAPPLYVLKKKRKNKSAKITSEEKLKAFTDLLKLKNPSILDITNKNVLADGISESCILCLPEEKNYYLYYILKMHPGKKIIFTNSVKCVESLYRLLNLLECYPKILFANMAQKQRLKNLENFEKNPNGLLLATDVAARGLDIPNIDVIVHYHIPKASEIYVHRSGRSVRNVTAQGTSIALCSPKEYYYYTKIRNILAKDSKYPTFTITRPEIFSVAKKVVDLGGQIDQIEIKTKQKQRDVNTIENMAREADIELDDDQKPEKIDDHTRKKQQREVKILKAKLKSLLLRPVLPLQESLKYPRFDTVQSYIQQRSLNKS